MKKKRKGRERTPTNIKSAQIRLFGLAPRKSLIAKEFDIYLQIFLSISHIKISIFSARVRPKKAGIVSIIGYKKFSLWFSYTLHSRRKWNSSSTELGQKGHTLSSFPSPLWRPTSIIRRWFDNLNLVISCLSETFFTLIR